MKKIYASLLIVTTTVLSATAQPFEKGDKLLGGGISFQNVNTSGVNNSSSNTSINIFPSIGFFTKPNRLTGFEVGYGYNTSNSSGSTLSKSHNFSAAVYKQYWNSLGKSFSFIIEGKLSGNYGFFKNNPSSSTERNTYFGGGSFSINPGLAYKINQRLLLDLFFNGFVSANYSHTDSNTQGSTDQFNLLTGFSDFTTDNIRFGFRYILK